ncbi:hypothetical protein OA57_08325 [Chelonobacter oris]|uniref:Strictosidine synthase conserved region domain-containing protein n=1 Tax=Chelonobacter oris TaxID=505317 RepID=A0A0A3B909_9PAST|nr:SMP-30/gluconolactonase/LRE family protein [Chelonobacter oris]KGQ70059.1 hypothetical protein OA57_08325 [Chelonobacter oris]
MKLTVKHTMAALILSAALMNTACNSIADTMHNNNPKQTHDLTKAASVTALHYINGIQSPEDLVAVPDSKWIIASGMAPKSGLHLIDSQNKTAQKWIAPKASSPSALYPDSEPQPQPDKLQAHGISLREIGGGKAHLYVVNHYGADSSAPTRETIEIFEVDINADKPTLAWLGNVRLPNGLAGNSVVAGADGAIYTTVMTHPAHTLEDMFGGKPTGAVYRWTPQTRRFEKLQGTELNGNNGIELSQDGKYIYVAHMQGVSQFTTANPAKRVATNTLNYGLADNLHWHGNVLITAGSMLQDCHQGIRPDCLKDFHITQINPENLTLKPVMKGRYTTEFSGVSTVLPVGNTYWLGSFYRNKAAYFTVK